MSIYEKILDKLKEKLAKSPSEEELRKFLEVILQDESPTQAFHQTNLSQVKEPTLFFTQLMVQDMRQSCYAYPFVIEKPFSEKSKTYLFKYGHNEEDFDPSLLQNPDFFTYLQDRQTVSCMPVVGESEWLRGLEKNLLKNDQLFEMIVDKVGVFRLGEIFSAVCIYHPQENLLYFVRKATEEQIKKWTNVDEYLSKEVKFQQTKQKLLALFNKLYEEKYSQYLLYTLLSNEHFFISATQNHSDLFRKLLPRVCQVKIQAPFKESFFPYKNQEEILINTQMQLSQNHTFVILDFSNFSNENQVKIGPEEIDNLKALKLFVEEGNTIYRWVYGESQFKHEHTGLVVKASSIINPQYVIPEKEKEKILKQVPEIEESDLRDFRSYIHQVRKLNPTLKDDRKEIEQKIVSQTVKFNEVSLVKVMELSKLNARSEGRDEIKTVDFDNSCKLFF